MGKIITVIIACLLLIGCKTKYITVPEVHTEYVHKTDTFVQKDSVHILDSVYVWQRGDTVSIERWRTKNVEVVRYKSKTDTLIMRDTIPVTDTVYVEKQDKASGFISGMLLMLMMVGMLAGVSIYLIKK